MQEAKGLYTEYLSKEEGTYTEKGTATGEQGLRFDQLSKKAKDNVLFYAVRSVRGDIKNATFEVATDTLNREAGTEGTSDSILNDKRLGETPDDVMQFFEDEAGESIVDMLKLLQRLDTQEVPASEGGPMSAQTAQMLAKGSIDATQIGVIESNRRAILDAVTSLLIKSPVLSEGGAVDQYSQLRLRRRTNRRKSDPSDSRTLGSWNSAVGDMNICLLYTSDAADE